MTQPAPRPKYSPALVEATIKCLGPASRVLRRDGYDLLAAVVDLSASMLQAALCSNVQKERK